MASTDTNDLNLGATLRGAVAEQKLFGRYTLKKILGRGGMGVVWLAHDDELVRNVAMKFLPDMIVRDREAVEDLKRETRRSLDLTHHHIVRIYDFTQDDQCAAIIMEYVDGESLSALKTRQDGGCFSVSTIQSWISHFCQAMDYAHRQARVVHRDLKPANLMVNGRGDLKVTDFGISRSMSDSMTRVSMSNSAGTLAYMSPEQALGSPPAVGDDVYAFGATAYDMLTGRPPFFRGNLQVQLETVIPPPMETRRGELGNNGEPIPALWEEVIAACLAKRPQDRPQSMSEIASLLGVSGSTTVGFRPTTHRGGGAHGPGTSPTAPATGTNSTTPATEVPKTGTAPTAQPPTARTAASNRALQPTRAEDVLFGYTPAPRVQTTKPPPAPPAPEPAGIPEVEPAPLVKAVAEPVVVPPEAPPAPIAAKAPPQVSPDSMTLEMSPVEPPPAVLRQEIPQVPPTTKPPAEPAIAATLIPPAVEPPAAVPAPKPAPPPPKPAAPAPKPEPAPTAKLSPPAQSVSTRTNVGHMIGSGAAKKSNRTVLIIGGVGAIALVALLGLWAGHSPKPDPRKAEIAAHVEAANTALTSGDLSAAEREIAAVQSLDPKNSGLGGLQSSFTAKKKAAEEEKTRQLAAEKAAAEKIAAIKAAADKAAAAEKLARDKQMAEQQAREQAAERERLAKLEQEKEAEMARQQQRQFNAAIAKVEEDISRREPAAARQDLNAAKQAKPADVDYSFSKLSDRIAALEEDLKPRPVTTTDMDDEPDKPDKPRRKPDKKPVAEVKPKPRREVEPEPQRPPPQRTQPTANRPTTPPKRPSNPFGPGGAPGG